MKRAIGAFFSSTHGVVFGFAALLAVYVALLFSQQAKFSSAEQTTFVISQLQVDGSWLDVHHDSFETEYKTKSYALVPNNGTIIIRINQTIIPFGDVDALRLTACGQMVPFRYARYAQTGESLKQDLTDVDHNVAIVHEMPIEASWRVDQSCANVKLEVTANEYGHASPLQFPSQAKQTMRYQFEGASPVIDVDGRLLETDGVRIPEHAPYWQPTTGHPAGNTYIYVMDDDTYLYAMLDITMDNTNEFGQDWAELVFIAPNGQEQAFRIDDFTKKYGTCAFGLTSKVSYKHQTCEFAIPKAELPDTNVAFYLRYYGTGGGPPPAPGTWDLDIFDNLPVPVQGASAAVLSGKIYLFGGIDDSSTHTDVVQIYDPAQPLGSRWSTDVTDPMPSVRAHGGAVTVGSKIYYLLGRATTNSADTEVFIYDPTQSDANRWSTGTAVTPGFERHSFAYAASGTEIFVIAGLDATDIPTDNVISYDTVGDTWETGTYNTAPQVMGRISGQNISGVIYVVGDDDEELYRYNIAGNSWTSFNTNTMFTHGMAPDAGCTFAVGDIFYYAIGDTWPRVFAYDTVAETIDEIEEFTDVRKRCASAVIGTAMYAFGGAPSGPGGIAWSDFNTLDVTPPAPAPDAPTLNYPDDASTRAGKVVLSAQYSHNSAQTGTTQYRVSTSSASDCLNNVSIEATSTSATTATDNEPTFVSVTGLVDGTKYWCARNDDGTTQSAWTTMGTFTQDSDAPYLNYSTFLGGTSSDSGYDLFVSGGTVYIVGGTDSSNFPATVGAYDTTLTGSSNVFIAGMSLDGAGATDLLFATYFGTAGGIGASTMYFDGSDIYIGGQTNATDLPIAGGTGGTPYDSTANTGLSSANGFISRFNSTASVLEYSTYFGGISFDDVDHIMVESGLTYVVGSATSDFPTTIGAFDATYGGSGDIYVAVFDLAGNGAADLIYSSYLGAGSDDNIRGMDVNAGILYLGGYADTSSYPTTAGAFDTTKVGFGLESILSVFEPVAGGASDLIYSTFLGGSDQESIVAVQYDTASNTIVGCGYTQSSDMATTTGAYATSLSGFTDGYVFRLNPAGGGSSDLQYGSFVPYSSGCSDAVLSGGHLYMTFNSINNSSFVTTADAYSNITTELGLVRFNLGGNSASDVVYSSYIGSASGNVKIAAEGEDIFIVGTTGSNLFPFLSDPGSPYDSTLAGIDDAFVARVNFPPLSSNPPVLRYPDNGAVRAGEVHLSVLYSHPVSVGTSDYRISSSSLVDCTNNINVVDFGSSVATTSNIQATVFSSPSLANGTYYWCARNNDGVLPSAWTAMGSFIKDATAPYVNYISYLGGSNSDSITDTASSGGLIYFVGTTGSTDLPTTVGVIDTTSNGGGDIFIGALDPSGGGAGDLEFLTYIGSPGADNSFSIRHSGSDLFIAGFTDSAAFPTAGGAYDTSHNGGTDAFAMRLNDTGTTIEYSTYVGGTGSDTLLLGEVASGVMYLGGTTGHSSFPTTAGAYDTSYNGGVSDNVIVVINPAGAGVTDLVYSTFMGGTSTDGGVEVAEFGGKIYFASDPFSSSHPTTVGSYDTSNNGAADLVFGRLNPGGGGSIDLEYSTFVGGSSNEFLNAFTIDQTSGEIYASGVATSGFPTTAGAYDTTFTDSELFIVKFDTSVAGSGALEYSTYVGGSGVEFADDIAFDGTDVYVAGASVSENSVITSATAYGNTRTNDTFSTEDAYLVRLTPAGLGTADLQYASYFGLVDVNERFTGISVDGTLVYLVGTTQPYSMEAFADPGAPFDSTPNGTDQDGFIMRIDFAGASAPPPPPAGGGSSIQLVQQQQSIAVPTAGIVTVQGPTTIRYEWSYGTTGNIDGFRLKNDLGAVAVQVDSPTAIAATEENLPHNTLVTGRTVVAFNVTGESAPSSAFPDAYTHMRATTPVLVSRQGDEIVVEINETLNNLTSELSGLQFELIPQSPTPGVVVTTSEWKQERQHTFTNTQPGIVYLLRSRARNHNGVQTAWSSSVTIPAQEVVAGEPILSVGLTLTAADGSSLNEPLNPNTLIIAQMTVANIGEARADNVLLTLLVPDYITYIPGTISVDGRKQSDGADGDIGQAGNDAVSAIWDSLQAEAAHTVRFQLGFDTTRLIDEVVKPRLREQALAAANPIIVLQAQASHGGDPEPAFSQPQSVEPDTDILEQSLTPEPSAPEPEPIEPQPEQEEPELPQEPVPTQEQIQIIQQILQQEFPTPGEPEPTPIPQGETTTSTDGGSFQVNTTDGSNQLGLSGFASTSGDQIEFRGTTTEPFVVVTLIFNNSVTSIVVSDANGNWQTFVSAEQLGIGEGESQGVRIEAVAAKGDLRSDRVTVADITVSRGRRGDIAADFEPLVSGQGFVRAVETVTETIQENEPAIQTTLSVAAPVIVVSSVPLWGYLPYAPTMIYHFITWLVAALGRKKSRAGRFYGVAYDSISKQPLALAIIRVYKVQAVLPQATSIGAAAANNKKLVTTVVTDKLGRFEALLEPGRYSMEVAKPGYLFPSQIVTTSFDGDHQAVYDSKGGLEVKPETVGIPDVPLDPMNAARMWQLASGPKKLWYALQTVGNYLAVPILIVGAVMSALVVVASPDKPLNWIIAVLYIGLLALQIKLRQKVEKAWGVVYDITSNAVLPLTAIQLIEPASSKVVTSRLSDYQGRFAFLPEPGTYVIKASKAGYQQVAEVVEAPQTDRQPLHGEISIEKPDQRISGDIAMRAL